VTRAVARVSGCVLLVEDDPLVAESVGALLAEWGAEVRCASDVTSAIAELQAGLSAIDFVISDYRLPGGSGVDVLRAARVHRPRARLALISADAAAVAIARAEDVRVLRKPIRARDLAALLS
jgi:DNA-binding NtrC family response regulator